MQQVVSVCDQRPELVFFASFGDWHDELQSVWVDIQQVLVLLMPVLAPISCAVKITQLAATVAFAFVYVL